MATDASSSNSAAEARRTLAADPVSGSAWKNLGESFVAAGEFAAAEVSADRLLAAHAASDGWLLKGEARLRRKQFAPALRCFRQGIALEPSSPWPHFRLAAALFALRRLTPLAPPAALRREFWRASAIKPTDLDILSWYTSQGLAAFDWRDTDRLTFQFRRFSLRVPQSGAQAVSFEDAGRSFGEIAFQFGIFAKARLLGVIPDFRLIAPQRLPVANPYLLRLFGGLLETPDAAAYERDRARLDALPRYNTEYLRWRDGRFYTRENAVSLIEREWESEPRPPLLKMEAEAVAFGKNWLQRRGVGPADWFVALHVRDPGYAKEMGHSRYEHLAEFRNADVRAYMPAIEHILSAGGRVVRMGSPQAPPLPRLDGLVDYAHDDDKHDVLDVYFCAFPRLFIGTASGPQAVPPLFGVPMISTNWPMLTRAPWRRNDLFLPKLMRWEAENRLLTLYEMVTPPLRFFDSRLLNEHRVRLIDNTADEILDAVKQLLAELAAGRAEDPAAKPLQDAVAKAVASVGCLINSRIADNFLLKHRHIFESPPSKGAFSAVGVEALRRPIFASIDDAR
jgi:putative glycosyltransferase (TIGR04372 family)